MAKLKPINKSLFVRKCTTGKVVKENGVSVGMIGDIVIPDWKAQNSLFYEILDVADDCEIFDKSHIGALVVLPDWHAEYIRVVVEKKLFIVKEKIFKAYKGYDGKWKPSPAPAMIIT